MRAIAAFPSEKIVRVIEHPVPRMTRQSDVILQILEVGICGTDREIAQFAYGTPPEGSPYLVMGHESLGQVLEVGSTVTHLRPGDLVVTMVRRPCLNASCLACQHGRQDFCFTGEFQERGIKGRHGFMTEQVVDDQRFMHPVPAHLRDVAVLTEPLTIAEKALLQVFDVQSRMPWTAAGAGSGHGQKALVLGAGPVGLLGALALLLRGFETWVYSRSVETSVQAAWVRSVGGKYLSATNTPVNALSEQIGNIDLVYEATGAANMSFQALYELGTNGVFVFTGVPGRKAQVALEADVLMRNLVLKNQLLFGTVNAGPDAFAAAISDLTKFEQRWPTQLRSLITSKVSLDACPALLTGESKGIKDVVRLI